MTAIGRSGTPSALPCARPNPWKLVEQTVSPILPRFETSTLSWILHDVHEPQSPEPVMTASQSATSSDINASGAGMDALCLRRLTTVATP